MSEGAVARAAVASVGRAGREGELVSQALFEERLAKVEDGQARLSADVRVLSHDVVGLKTDVGQVKSGIDQLLQREARRPEPLGWKSIVAACAGLATVAVVGWWLVGHAPAVLDLARRLDKLDDPDVGRVPRLEREAGWAARIIKN